MKTNLILKCGDSRVLLRELPDRSVDLILTDPPYNLGKFSTGNIKLPWRREINNDVAGWDRKDFNPEETEVILFVVKGWLGVLQEVLADSRDNKQSCTRV